MKVKTTGNISGNYKGVAFDIPEGTILEVEGVKGNVTYCWYEEDQEVVAIYSQYLKEV